MKKPILIVGIFASVLAMHGCTTHQHHHHYSGNIGIATTPKGAAGTEGKSGTPGDPEAAKSSGLKKMMPSGYAGAEGPAGIMPTVGQSSSLPGSTRSMEAKPEPFDESFWEKAILNIMQWCVLTQCGK